MKIAPFLFLMFLANICFAQKQNVYFLKNNGTYVETRDSADYIRIVRPPDSASALYNIFEFYKNDKPKLRGQSLKIDPPKFEGQCITYFPSGTKKGIITYKNGSITGALFSFYPNGKIYTVREYPEDGRTDNDFRENYLIKSINDSTGVALVTDGEGYGKIYTDDYKTIAEEGPVKDGRRNGLWKGTFKNPKVSFTETYSDGILNTGTALDSEGKSIIYTKSRSMIPQFKGGVKAFEEYLGNNIRYPDYDRRNGIEGMVIISFVIEKDGSVADVKVSKSAGKELDEEAVRVIKKSPLWIPGSMFGRPVRVSYSVPVNFALRK